MVEKQLISTMAQSVIKNFAVVHYSLANLAMRKLDKIVSLIIMAVHRLMNKSPVWAEKASYDEDLLIHGKYYALLS